MDHSKLDCEDRVSARRLDVVRNKGTTIKPPNQSASLKVG